MNHSTKRATIRLIGVTDDPCSDTGMKKTVPKPKKQNQKKQTLPDKKKTKPAKKKT
jgi:hypothetical protein